MAALALAGCSGLTEQEFEATPAVLTDEGRTEFGVDEVARDSPTLSREIESIDGKVTITNHVASYARGPARGTPTLIEAYLSGRNGTPGSGSAVIAHGPDLGLGDFRLGGSGNAPAIGPDQVTVVAPEAARAGGSNAMATIGGVDVSAMATIGGVDVSAIPTLGSDFMSGLDAAYVFDAKEFFPGTQWIPDSTWFPGTQWVPRDDGNGATPDSLRVLLFANEGVVEETFGAPAGELPGERVTDFESYDTGNNPFLVVAPAAATFGGDLPFATSDVFDAGVPAPLGGATFGLGVLSTPAAKVAGNAVNPLAGMGYVEMLTDDRVAGALDPNVPGLDSIEWLGGPRNVTDEPGVMADDAEGSIVTLLDQESQLESFAGVIDGPNGPLGVGVHMARVEYEGDVVITAGVHHWPEESADAATDDEFAAVLGGGTFTGARTLMRSVVSPYVVVKEIDKA